MKKVKDYLCYEYGTNGKGELKEVEGYSYQLGDYELLLRYNQFTKDWDALYKGDGLSFARNSENGTCWWHGKWKWGQSPSCCRTRKELIDRIERNKEDLIILIKENENKGEYKLYDKLIIEFRKSS